VIPTILSRCQIYDFARITVPDIVEQLQYVCEQEHITAEKAALNVIAQKADGAMRDALSIFDQVAASTEGNITYQSALDNLNVLDYDYYFRLVDTFCAGDVQQSLLIYKDIRDKGFDSQFFVNGLAQHLRDLMVASSPKTRVLLEMNDDVAQQYETQAATLSPDFLYRAIDLCNICDLNYRNASSKQLLVELTLIKLCQLVENPKPAEPTQPTIKKIRPAANGSTPTTTPPAQSQPPKSSPAPQQQVSSVPDAQQMPKSPTRQQAPAHPATSTSQPRPIASPKLGGVPRIMVNNLSANTVESKVETKVMEKRNEAFTPEQVLAAWEEYIIQHPKEKALLATMGYAKPSRLDSEVSYGVKVSSPNEQTYLNEAMPSLVQFLCDAVHNDHLTIQVSVDENVETPKIYSPREIVEEIKAENPAFNDFLRDFDLGLA